MERDDAITRRSFVQLLGAGLAAACEDVGRQDVLLPYTRAPEGVIPGRPQRYATCRVEGGYATGLVAESHAGRPTRVDGNPDHPASLGATGVREQAWVMELYDPGRVTDFLYRGRPAGSEQLARAFAAATDALGPAGEGLHFLLPPQSSPLVASQIARVQQRLPAARFHLWEPLASGSIEQATRAAFGRALVPRLDLTRASVVLAADADFLGAGPFCLRHAHDFAERRRVRQPGDPSNRLYAVEGDVSLTGAIADHRLALRPSAIPAFLARLLGEVLRLSGGGALRDLPGEPATAAFEQALARDLLAHRGEAVVIAGDRQPAAAHVLAAALNDAIASEAIAWAPSALLAGEDLLSLIAELRAGRVRTLVAIDSDLALEAPADLDAPSLLARVPVRVHAALHAGATGQGATWTVPLLHGLESWGDARAYDGTVSFQQPLIRPMYAGLSLPEILAIFAGDVRPDAGALLRSAWSTVPFDEALRQGLLPGSAFPAERQAADPQAVLAAASDAARPRATAPLELSLREDLKLRDGRDANDWLLELPDPVTSLSWDNAALLAPATAASLGLRTGRIVRLSASGRTLEIPVLEQPGIAEGVVSLALGWGRRVHPTEGLRGANAFVLRTTAAPWIAAATLEQVLVRDQILPGVPIGPGRAAYTELAVAQPERGMHGREAVLETLPLSLYAREPHRLAHLRGPSRTIYGDPWPDRGRQWGMAVDLDVCTGCAACTVACQAENNIPVVGKINVRKGRIMHWLRIDRYLLGDAVHALQLLPQPMLCQHCEKAPCEYVCPVNATVHSPDGLNEMVYNRCVGTRFCSNNCPYKVRRFNWLEFNDVPETVRLQKNPEVTVRARGVMEKCTYCVQRIRRAEIEARIEGREIREGEVRTACQQACPTAAIVFGLVSDPESEVSRLHRQERAYAALHELGTEPRTRYLAHLRSVNGELS